ncbi:hypothetical protein C8A00DRAFT_18272 [Chaetomidium leptoderma]|uniref:Uncharacterized protein n=1 Tax=Chaetomidium leptoderma TaxID=669021 RepID=A0AAN6VHC8_9PEZI|nr:hypothetical protein C8A00DRAFT_18272 [Chaetomidium leptoderma]
MAFPWDHHPALGIERPPLLSTVFCQPIAVGGPNGLSLDFTVWPILVPGGDKEEVMVCYTRDKQFRNKYMERGYCGLDASFRGQFEYNCPEQIIHIAPTVREDDQHQSTQVHRPGTEDGSKRGGRNPKRHDDKPSLVRSIYDFFSAPSRRHFMNIMHSIRRHFERFDGDVETVIMVIIYLSFYPVLCLPSLFYYFVIFFIMSMVLEMIGLVGYSQTEDGAPKKVGNAPNLSKPGRPRRSKTRPPAANTAPRRRPSSPERKPHDQHPWRKPETNDVPGTVAANNKPRKRRVEFSFQHASSTHEPRQRDPEFEQDTDDTDGLATPSSMDSLGSID